MTDTKVTGLSFSSALFLVFLVLKLCDVIDWSWWFVSMPLWAITAARIGAVAVIVALAFVIAAGSFIIIMIIDIFDRDTGRKD